MMINKLFDASLNYIAIRFLSALFFATIVTVNLVYQVTVVGLNPLQLILVGTLLEATTFLFEVPTGIVADVYSRKLSVLIGLFLIGIGFSLQGFFPVYSIILLSQIVWGIGYTFVSGAREAWITDEIGKTKASKTFTKGAQWAQAGTFIGIGLSVFLAKFDIRIPIIIGGFLYSSQALIFGFLMPEKNFVKSPNSKRKGFAGIKTVFITGLKTVRTNNTLIILVVISVLLGMFSEGFDRLWTPYMINSFTFPEYGGFLQTTWFGIFKAVSAIIAILAMAIVSKLTTLQSQKSIINTLINITFVLMVSTVVFGIASNFWIAIASFWLVIGFREAQIPLYATWLNQHVPKNIRATVFSFMSQADAIGQIVGGPILGLIAISYSIRYSLVASGFVLLLVTYLLRRTNFNNLKS